MAVVTAEYKKYGGKYYFIFDSEEWRDRIFISNPTEALIRLNNLQKTNAIDNKIDLVKLFKMVVKEQYSGFLEDLEI